MQETITVQKIWPPSQGKKLANAVTPSGKRYGFDPGKVDLREGGTFVVETSSRDFNGKTYFNVEKVVGANGGVQGALPSSRQEPDATAERIYVCGIVNSTISAGSFEPTTANLVALTNAARAAWAQTFGGKAQQRQDDPFEPPAGDPRFA